MKTCDLLRGTVMISFLLGACSSSVSQSPSAAPTSPAPVPTLPGPSPTAAAAIAGTVTQSLDGCSFAPATDPITQGRVEFTAVNETDSQVNFDVLRIGDGSTYDQLSAHISMENDLSEAGKQGLGPPSFVEFVTRIEVQPHQAKSQAGRLSPGTYAIVCTNLLYAPEGRTAWFITGPFNVD